MTHSNDFIVVEQMPLSQKRYQNGLLYISVPFNNNEIIGLDVRYFVHDNSDIIPTRSGFRIPVSSLHAFKKILKKKIESIDSTVCTYFSDRQLKACYRSDDYGEGVDIRYYKVSDEYTGWERRGLRFQVDDFKEFRERVLKIDFSINAIMASRIILKGNVVRKGPTKGKTSPKTLKKNVNNKGTNILDEYVNEAIKELMDV